MAHAVLSDKKTLRIGFFTDDYLPYVHGVTRSLQNYRQALEALGHEVFIIAPKHPEYEDDDHIIRMNSVNSYVFDKRPMSIVYPGMARKFDKYKFDVVHTQTQFWLGTLGYMVAKRQGIPHISTVHTLFPELIDDYPAAIIAGVIAASIGYPIAFKAAPVLPFEMGSIESFRQANRDLIKTQAWRLTNIFLNHTSACVTPSQHLAQTLEAHGLRAPHFVLPNGIEPAMYRTKKTDLLPAKKPKNEQWIVAVGRLSGEKRQKVLVEAMQHMKTLRAKLVLVGPGPEEANLKRLAKDLNVQKKVLFFGDQPRESVAQILQQGDIFTLASYRFDNQPMVILEAIASGLPIVYCDDQLREGLGKNNALLTKNEQAPAFAAAFDELLNDKKRRQTMAAASLELSAQFDSSRLARRLVAIYQQAPAVE